MSCPCGFSGELFFSAEKHWQRPCPSGCGKTLTPESQKGQRFYGMRQFHGSECESITEGCHPSEVSKARQMFEGTGTRVRDDGVYEFSSRSVERAYQRRKAELGL